MGACLPSAKTVVALQIVSQELFEDLSDEAASIVANEMASALALALDLAYFEGTGASNQPTGLLNQAGVQTVTLGGANGLKPTSYAHLVQARSNVAKQNGDASSAAWVAHPRDVEILDLLADSTGQPLRKPPAIEAMPVVPTTQLATTRTVGTSTDTSNSYLGDFSQTVIGVRPRIGVQTRVLSERYADNLQIGLLVWLRADVAALHPEHVTVIKGQRIV